ncbi:MAG TPA: amino acid racemase [Candidatus Latescibacteria bacterium]|nr:amino acid racemase [Candidatus Latescibacterota bacterium]
MPGKVLGVLGGMGPEATVAFLAKVVEKTPAERDQDHLHVVVDMDPSVPDRTDALLSGRTGPVVEALSRMARRLVGMGAELLAIPCNTAHVFLDEIREAVPVPVLDMIGEVVETVTGATSHLERVGLLATTGTMRSGLYRRRFSEFGVEVLEPPFPDQGRLMKGIRAIKAGKHEEALKSFRDVAGNLSEAGAQVLVTGCTELSLLLPRWEPPVPCFDALDILAEAAVREALKSATAD